MLLKELRYITAIKEYGTISGAADSLYISQPALSKYIHGLESSLGIKLFEKAGKRIIPTDAGLKYIETAKSMLQTYDAMMLELQHSDNLIHGILRIGTSNSRSPLLLSQTIPEFHSLFPNIEVQLFEESSYKLEYKLAEGHVDILITKGPVTTGNKFTVIPLFTEELLLSLPSDHPMASQSVKTRNSEYDWIDLSLLSEESFVLLKKGHYTRVIVDQLFASYNFFPSSYIATSNIETAILLSANGMGPTFVPSFFAKNKETENLNLSFFSVGLDGQQICSSFNIIMRQDTPLTRYMKHFIKLIQDRFGSGTNLV